MQRRDFLFLATAAATSAAVPQVASATAPRAARLTADDYMEIQQLYARYPHALDGNDPEGYAALFTPDGSFNNNVGRDALLAFVRGRNPDSAVRHFTANLAITATPEGAKGTVYNLFVDAGRSPPAVIGASRYEDTLVKTAEGWRFKTRVNRTEAGSGNPANAATAAVNKVPFTPIRP
jgi:hypothetical protein